MYEHPDIKFEEVAARFMVSVVLAWPCVGLTVEGGQGVTSHIALSEGFGVYV
jgi:hypothetical protein